MWLTEIYFGSEVLWGTIRLSTDGIPLIHSLHLSCDVKGTGLARDDGPFDPAESLSSVEVKAWRSKSSIHLVAFWGGALKAKCSLKSNST